MKTYKKGVNVAPHVSNYDTMLMRGQQLFPASPALFWGKAPAVHMG
jgi:hypothetical protein